jgi:hypothetical protein
MDSRKLDEEGKLLINEQNVPYLMEILAKVEEKVNGLYEISKHLDRIPARKEIEEERQKSEMKSKEDVRNFQENLSTLVESSNFDSSQ